MPFLLMGQSGLVPGAGSRAGAVVGGVGALVIGVAGFLLVPSPGLLGKVFACVVTLRVLVAGVLAWRAPGRQAVACSDAAAPA